MSPLTLRMAEEESVAGLKILKLPLDDAGKEWSHLETLTNKNLIIFKDLTIPSSGAVSARPPVKLSTAETSLLYVLISLLPSALPLLFLVLPLSYDLQKFLKAEVVRFPFE